MTPSGTDIKPGGYKEPSCLSSLVLSLFVILGFALVALIFGAVVLFFTAHPAHAQDATTVEVGNQAAEASNGAGATKFLVDGLKDAILQAWENWIRTSGVMTLLHGLTTGLGLMAQSYLQGVSKVGGESCDVMSRLDTDCVLADPVVQGVMERSIQVFNALLGVGIVFLGFKALISFGGEPLKELGMVLPRLLIALVLVNKSADLIRTASAATQQIGSYLVSGNTQDIGGVIRSNLSPEEAGGTLLILVGVMSLLLIQRIVMHALLGIIAMLAALAFAAFVIPSWSQWFWRWATLFVGLVAGAALQTLLVQTGSSMLSRAIAHSEDGSKAATAGLFALGTLAAAISAPALVGGGMLLGGSTLGLARSLTRHRRLRGKSQGEEDQDVTPGRAIPHEVTRSGPKEETILVYQRLTPLPAPAQQHLPPPEYTSFTPPPPPPSGSMPTS